MLKKIKLYYRFLRFKFYVKKNSMPVRVPSSFRDLSVTDYYSLNKQVIIDDWNDAKDKEKFRFYGLNVYVAPQGGGKTSTMIYHALRLKSYYPKLQVYSNIRLNVDFDYIYIEGIEQIQQALRTANNGKYGCLLLLDEIQTYFNSLQSKYISLDDMAAIAQQRKRHLAIFGTVQYFNRLAKGFREQCFNVISCNTYFQLYCSYHVYDGSDLTIDENGKYTGTLIKNGFYMQTPKLRSSYNTYDLINLSSGVDNSQFEVVRPVKDK